MKIGFLNKFIIVIIFTLIESHLNFSYAQAPKETWEHWLIEIKAGKKPTPQRPDRKNLFLSLPIWVDCHLSWITDHPQNKIQIPDEIILQSSSKICRNQMETWAPK